MPCRRSLLIAVILALTVLSAATACARGSGQLDGTRWRLIGWTISSLYPGDFTITAAFADGRISGRSGVNSYGGPCQVGPGDAFAVGQLESTLMAGPEPAMRAERAYLMLLAEARSYRVADGTLTLYGAGGHEALIFEAAE